MAHKKVPVPAPVKRRNKRKARTEVSDDSSSDSSSGESGSRVSSPEVPPNNTVDGSSGPVVDVEQYEAPAPAPAKRQVMNPEQRFREFYLRQATKEFANDLDLLRSVADFGPKSVGLLVGALEQGGMCFGVEERRRVGVGSEGGG